MPCAISSLSRNFSITWLNESSGFCSKKPGQVSQQDPQLTHVERSILTFIGIRLFLIGLNDGHTGFSIHTIDHSGSGDAEPFPVPLPLLHAPVSARSGPVPVPGNSQMACDDRLPAGPLRGEPVRHRISAGDEVKARYNSPWTSRFCMIQKKIAYFIKH